jgi:hypothetical protein
LTGFGCTAFRERGSVVRGGGAVTFMQTRFERMGIESDAKTRLVTSRF